MALCPLFLGARLTRLRSAQDMGQTVTDSLGLNGKLSVPAALFISNPAPDGWAKARFFREKLSVRL